MATFTFTGGVHPYDGKELTKDKPIQVILPQGELVYPLSQHIGAPAVPIVKKGDRVLAGQKIAEASAFVSVPVHASVSGGVKAIEPRRVAAGEMAQSIVVENDGRYEEAPPMAPLVPEKSTREELIERIKEAGIVGMGGAGFPTFIKLSPPKPDKIEYVIANCSECEPYLTSDYRRMKEEPEKLVGGLKTVLCLFPKAHGILAVEDNKKDCVELLKELVKDEKRISVRALKTKYPQGAERQLIYAVTGRRINSSMLPADAGCVVNNVDTLAAVYAAVAEGKPLTGRIITVTGDAIRRPCNFNVRTGTSFRELIEGAGGFRVAPAKLIAGGPMMGISLFDLDVPATKTTSAILALSRDDVSDMPSTACIRCGRCVEVCPGRVLPVKLMEAALHGDEETFLKLNGMECCECGCCSYICPARRPLTQTIKSMRKQQLAKRKNR